MTQPITLKPHTTIRRISESKNFTPMSHPTPISKALTNSIHGRCHGVAIVSIYDLGKIILAKMYPSVIHLIVSLRYV